MATALDHRKLDTLADLQRLPQSELIAAITAGLPATLARELAERMKITLEQLGALLRLTPRTLQRRLEEGALELVESERLWELSRLFLRAADVLESEAGAVQWFKSPVQALGWKTPLTFAQTTVGLRAVENVLGRIEHGVFS